MNIDWMVIKEKVLEVFAKLSQVVVFQLACLYFLACVVAAAPVGPKGYVGFIYHCFQWHPSVQKVSGQTVAGKR
jgi:hypothetical protein